MASGKTIFWDVDTQVDFLSPQGKLSVPGAERMIPNLGRLTQWAAEQGVLVVASACAHHPEDKEFGEWPPHCLVDTDGQRKIAETVLEPGLTIPNRVVDLPSSFSAWRQIVVEKQELDVFSNPNTEKLVAALGYPDVTLYGVVTELCVSLAARQLLERGCRVALVEDAVCALDAAKASRLIAELRALGGTLTTAAEVTAAKASALPRHSTGD